MWQIVPVFLKRHQGTENLEIDVLKKSVEIVFFYMY